MYWTETKEKFEREEAMLYCTKCRCVCDTSLQKCPNCKSGRHLRPAAGSDYVFLQRADVYSVEKLTGLFEDFSVDYRLEKYREGRVSYLYDSEVMPTDQSVFVAYKDYAVASGLAAQAAEEINRERYAEETPEDSSVRKKRMVVNSLFVVLFLLLVMAVVFGADALATWLRGIFFT